MSFGILFFVFGPYLPAHPVFITGQ